MRIASIDQLQKLASDVLTLAAKNGLRAGDRLPPERELASRLQLSRTTIRNVLARLAHEGLVAREVGRGTFLRDNPHVTPMLADGSLARSTIAGAVSPSHVMAARQLVEPAVMSSIIDNATINDFAEIERCLVGGEGAADYDDVEKWDLALHHAFIRAAHNPLLESMYLLIDEARRSETWGNLKQRSDSEERRQHYRVQHRTIADALRDRDGRRAREAMQVHLDTVDRNFLESSKN